jgi:hypothetical protein
VSETTFDAWKKKYAGMGVAQLRRVKQLEEENRCLKQVVATRHREGGTRCEPGDSLSWLQD